MAVGGGFPSASPRWPRPQGGLPGRRTYALRRQRLSVAAIRCLRRRLPPARATGTAAGRSGRAPRARPAADWRL